MFYKTILGSSGAMHSCIRFHRLTHILPSPVCLIAQQYVLFMLTRLATCPLCRIYCTCWARGSWFFPYQCSLHCYTCTFYAACISQIICHILLSNPWKKFTSFYFTSHNELLVPRSWSMHTRWASECHNLRLRYKYPGWINFLTCWTLWT